METSQEILIIGGIALLVLGVLSGNAMAFIRKDEPQVPKYLTVAHTGAYMQAAMLLGLAFAIELSDLSSGWETLAAWMLVIGALLLFIKDIYNWLAGVADEFASRGVGLALGFLMGPLHTFGILIIGWGCLRAVL